MLIGFSPWGNSTNIAPFDAVFDESESIIHSHIKNYNAIVLWGGTDIDPAFYKQARHPYNGASRERSERDTFEWKAVKLAVKHGIPIIGVCRGAQLLTAFAGGKLIQHCDGHHTSHDMITNEGSIIKTTSSHHQMMVPDKTEHELIAWSCSRYYGQYEDDKGKVNMDNEVEAEIVYYPKIKGLAIQGHPEWAVGSVFANYCNRLVKEYLFRKQALNY